MAGPQNIVYFDLETQRTAGDVGGWENKRDMGMSVGVTYSTATESYRIYHERNVDALVAELLRADLVVGYNHIKFDFEVLTAYTVLDLAHHVPSFDMLLEAERILGHRLKLEAISQATLQVGKIADGIDAIKWWREGKLHEIAEYCCFDVKVTRLIYEHAERHGELHYLDKIGTKQRFEIQVPKRESANAPQLARV